MTQSSLPASPRTSGAPGTPRTLAVVSAGLSQPSSTRLLADKLAAATARDLADAGSTDPSEPEGLGAAWTEERGTSDEGRRRLQEPRRRAGNTEIVVIELRDLAHDIMNNLLTGFPSPALRTAIGQVEAADGLIAVTPLYSGSYSGLFKSFFDVLDTAALTGKPTLIAATGGTARHSLALEHAVRPLFSYLRAVTVPTAVFAATDDWGSVGGPAGAGAALGGGAGAALGGGAGAALGGGAGAALGERIDRAAAELAALIDQRPAATQSDPYALVTPFDQLLGAH